MGILTGSIYRSVLTRYHRIRVSIHLCYLVNSDSNSLNINPLNNSDLRTNDSSHIVSGFEQHPVEKSVPVMVKKE